ncbi:MAG: orotidine-5'-phosphate decarboxylase [Acidobacteriota bacterium]
MIRNVAVALDTADFETFEDWCRYFGPRVGVLKVGLESYVTWGPRAVEVARRHADRVFLDVKLHDIPNTVAGAVRAAAELGVDLLTVHAGGGRRMLEAAAEAAAGRVGVLGVTVLTHLDADDLEELGLPGSAESRVEAWATLVRRSGCAGIVCSPLEAAKLRAAHGLPFELVTPGIRLANAAADDQRRVATPASATGDGSSLLVIGRPLTQAEDPGEVLAAIESDLATLRQTTLD